MGCAARTRRRSTAARIGKALPFGGTIGIAAPASPNSRYSDVLRSQLGRLRRYHNRKVRLELGIEFIPVEETIVETADDLIRWRRPGPRSD